MSKREKLRRKLKNNPKDVSLQDVKTLLGYFGFVLVRIVGSHHVFRYDDGKQQKRVVLPVHGKKVKSQYVKQAMEQIDILFPEEQEGEDDAE